MKKLRIAVDTSVISGIKDSPARNREVKRLFRECGKFKVDIYLPPTIIMELWDAPLVVKWYVVGLSDAGLLNTTYPISALKKKKAIYKKLKKQLYQYLEKGVIKKTKISDAIIYLECSIISTDYLITYDKKHFLNPEIIKQLNSLLKKHRIKPVTPILPKDFINKVLHKKY
ncbi:hypothetical protein [Methanocaldococcus sp.]